MLGREDVGSGKESVEETLIEVIRAVAPGSFQGVIVMMVALMIREVDVDHCGRRCRTTPHTLPASGPEPALCCAAQDSSSRVLINNLERSSPHHQAGAEQAVRVRVAPMVILRGRGCRSRASNSGGDVRSYYNRRALLVCNRPCSFRRS